MIVAQAPAAAVAKRSFSKSDQAEMPIVRENLVAGHKQPIF
jgi:hypothetical protein